MKTVIRYQSQPRKLSGEHKPNRIIRIRPTQRPNLVFRPMNRFGAKPQLTIVS